MTAEQKRYVVEYVCPVCGAKLAVDGADPIVGAWLPRCLRTDKCGLMEVVTNGGTT